MARVDGSGTLVEAKDYYPYGLELPGRTTEASPSTKEDFTGHETDAATGLVYAGARYYMPAVPRWTAVDPLADASHLVGWSPYHYAYSNPVTYSDPDGKNPIAGFVIGGLAEYGTQVTINYLSGKSLGESFTDVDGGAIAVSAVSGLATGGIGNVIKGARAINKLRKAKQVKQVAELAVGTGAGVAEGAAKAALNGQDYSFGDAAFDGLAGAAGTVVKLGADKVIDATVKKAEQATSAALDARSAASRATVEAAAGGEAMGGAKALQRSADGLTQRARSANAAAETATRVRNSGVVLPSVGGTVGGTVSTNIRKRDEND